MGSVAGFPRLLATSNHGNAFVHVLNMISGPRHVDFVKERTQLAFTWHRHAPKRQTRTVKLLVFGTHIFSFGAVLG